MGGFKREVTNYLINLKDGKGKKGKKVKGREGRTRNEERRSQAGRQAGKPPQKGTERKT